jgi:hypothetical protein
MFALSIAPDGQEPYEVDVAIRDCVKWERAHPGRSAIDLEKTVTLSDSFELAFFAAKRLGRFTGTQDEFENTCDVTASEPAMPDPTPPDRSGDSSSSSRSGRGSRRASGSNSAGKAS